MLKKCLFFLYVSVLFAQNTFAADISRQHLPEGVKARLGKGSVLDIVYSPDGTRLAVASRVGLWIYETASYREIALCTDQAWNLTFSPDGSTIAGMSFIKSTVYLWDAKTSSRKYVLTGHQNPVTSVVFSPNSATLATTSRDKSIRLWDVETGRLKNTLIGHASEVYSAAFSRDSKTLATASSDKTVRLWDVKLDRLKNTLIGHTDIVWSVVFSSDGRTLTTVSDEGTVFLWDVPVTDDR